MDCETPRVRSSSGGRVVTEVPGHERQGKGKGKGNGLVDGSCMHMGLPHLSLVSNFFVSN